MTASPSGVIRKPKLIWFVVLFVQLAWIAILEVQIAWQGKLLEFSTAVAPGLSRQQVVSKLGRPYLSTKDGLIAGSGTRELYYTLHGFLRTPDFVVVLDRNDRVMSWCFTEGPTTPRGGIALPHPLDHGTTPPALARAGSPPRGGPGSPRH